MKRLHLIEFADAAACPRSLRAGLTDVLQYLTCLGHFYDAAAERLLAQLPALGEARVLDLCSGSGGPWPRLVELLRRAGRRDLRITLSDSQPAPAVWQALAADARGLLDYAAEPVDARQVPAHWPGCRTLFSAFHHFPPAAARAILADAVARRVPIGVFEFTGRRWFALFMVLTSPLVVPFVVPLVRPFRWSRLFWTYVLPALPLLVAYDGLVSCLRTYSPAELRELVAGLPPAAYEWDIGEARSRSWSPLWITYAIGRPRPGPEAACRPPGDGHITDGCGGAAAASGSAGHRESLRGTASYR